MKAHSERVIAVHHWSDRLFTIKTTRHPSMRFRSGEFAMIGLEIDGKPLMRAYSMASSHHDDHLEFYSIKVPGGAFTSRLKNIKVGDPLLVSKKPTGTLLWDHLRPGKRLYLLSTGTGLAPFLSIIKDPEVYENFASVILVHGCRYINELTYQKLITEELQRNPYFGDRVREKLLYYPAVTREPDAKRANHGRITELITSGKLMRDLNLPPLSVPEDRFMLCGSIRMLASLSDLLKTHGFRETKKTDHHEFVVERAFVDQ